MPGLFNEFNKVSSKEWKQKIQMDLKGADYQTLITRTPEHIDIKPFYHYDDFIAMEQPAPQSFKICQELYINHPGTAGSIARNALEKGAQHFTFYFDKQFDIQQLISKLDPERLIFKAGLLDTDFIKKLYKQTKGKSQILIDPVGHLVRYGNWYENEQKDFEKLKELQEFFPGNFRFLEIRSDHYKDAGATITQELAYALSHAIEYTEKLGKKSLNQIQFTVANGSHYFFEITKLKALRYLWQLIGNEYNVNVSTEIYTRPSIRNKTIFDPYVNMLRTGMEMMSAVLGGSDYVANMPFDAVYHKSNEFSERIARNQLLILQKEAGFEQALTSTEGDYYMEETTYKLAGKTLEIFKQVEKAGGLLAQLYKGKIQEKIAGTAAKEQALFDEGKLVLVGTNKYPNSNEPKPKIDFYPFMKKRSGQTLITPLIPKRLAEKNEQERLKKYGIKF